MVDNQSKKIIHRCKTKLLRAKIKMTKFLQIVIRTLKTKEQAACLIMPQNKIQVIMAL